MPISVISAASFTSAFLLRPSLFAWFLGAGASAASGIPTGYQMISDFKKKIYCRETGYSTREVDTADELWRSRIDNFFQNHALLPPAGDPTEYSAAFEAIYPKETLRRQYIDDAVKKGVPSFGHRLLAALMSNKQLNCLFTTNFDSLVEDSVTLTNELLPAEARAKPVVAAIDSADRATRALAESDWPLIAKLHGDYQSVEIKNTGNELVQQDARMRTALVEVCTRFGLIVVGYSGRDRSIMDTLESVLRDPTPYPNGLYWVCSSSDRLLPTVKQLLENASLCGVDVHIVEAQTFDELAADIFAQVSLPANLLEHVAEKRVQPRLEPVALNHQEARKFPVLRYSALRVTELPKQARRIVLDKSATTSEVRALLKQHKCRAVVSALGRELAAFGRDTEIVAALSEFGARAQGSVELRPLSDSWALGLLYDALVRTLSRDRPLLPRFRHSGHSLVVRAPPSNDDQERIRRTDAQLLRLRSAYGSNLTGVVPVHGYQFQEGVSIKLEHIEGRWWCGFEPTSFVDLPKNDTQSDPVGEGEDAEQANSERRGDPAGDWRRERWAQRYNRKWAEIIDAWAAVLSSGPDTGMVAFGLSEGEGIDAQFRVSLTTAWSRAAHHHDYFERTK